MMRKFLTTIAIIVSVCNIAFSQIEEASIGYIRFSKPYISKGELDISKNGTPFKFAEPIDVGINIADYAELNHDRGTISLTCQSDGAKSLNAILTISSSSSNFELFISDQNDDQLFGPFSYDDFTYGYLPTPLISGDVLKLKIIKKDAITPNVTLLTLGYDYVGVANKDGFYGSSGSCNIDVRCPEAVEWENEKSSVVRLIINSQYLCSGVIVNNLRNDKKPYMLTANHCVADSITAAKTVAYFNYESPSCNGPDSPIQQIRPGFLMRATKNDSIGTVDFALLEAKQPIPEHFNANYAGWDASGRTPTNTVAIHHPRGDVKKISFSNKPPLITSYPYISNYDKNSFWKVTYWDLGTTEGGSSGSPLFDQNHNVIGVLTGGTASCESLNPDYFTQVAYAWDKYPEKSQQLKYWLNPDNLPTRICGILGIEDLVDYNSESDVELYPNPTSSNFSFKWRGQVNKVLNIEVFSYCGKKIAQYQQKTPPDKIINCQTDLQPGFYIIHIYDNKYSNNAKLLITK
ncbi:MAG: trypsin-like peptidase domain-containing protein [Salinivirgaceae bacterium]|jgi:lysyl endopeptidase|nr:trypsin-like serine protease [Bacteroidales bacterium]